MKFNPLDPEFLAQLVHVFAGAFAFLVLYERVLPFGEIWFGLSISSFLFIILVKEAFWDPVHEANNPFFWQGVEDWVMYPVGFALAAVAIFAPL